MTNRVDVSSIRRAQIVEAATRVIAGRGIQNASLSEIEEEAGISRGLLTYHFRSKDELILAVFDAMLARLKRTIAERAGDPPGLERAERVHEYLLADRPRGDALDCLHYTFLAQMSHREDFRARLAANFADMRRQIAADLAAEIDRRALPPIDVEAVSAVVGGAVHGLLMQLNADPDALDGRRLLAALRSMIRGYLDPLAAAEAALQSTGPPG